LKVDVTKKDAEKMKTRIIYEQGGKSFAFQEKNNGVYTCFGQTGLISSPWGV
jgi:hypothetical protein